MAVFELAPDGLAGEGIYHFALITVAVTNRLKQTRISTVLVDAQLRAVVAAAFVIEMLLVIGRSHGCARMGSTRAR